MTKQAQSHIIASIGTVLTLGLIFMLLWLLHINMPQPVEEEGIVLAFGYAEDGGGTPDVTPEDVITQVEQLPAPPTYSTPSENELMVQEDEESLLLAQQTEEENKRKAAEEALLRQRKEQEAIAEAERIAHEKALAEQRAKEQEAIEKANKLAALFGQAGAAEGANAQDAISNATAATHGNPIGKGYGSVNNSTWTLYGRDCKRLPKPSSEFGQAGVVIVSIQVDKAGNVTNATIAEGTTISDRQTQLLAIQAARQAKFTEGDTPQLGKISYTFKLN